MASQIMVLTGGNS